MCPGLVSIMEHHCVSASTLMCLVSIIVCHYDDVIMSAMASQIISLTIVYSIVYTGTDQRKHEFSASLAFVRWIHRWPVNSPHERASGAKYVSIWWRHHEYGIMTPIKRYMLIGKSNHPSSHKYDMSYVYEVSIIANTIVLQVCCNYLPNYIFQIANWWSVAKLSM